MSAASIVGILDSGVGREQAGHVEAGRGFTLGDDGAVASGESYMDEIGHGQEIAKAVLAAAPAARLAVARVFAGGFTSQPVTIAAGLDWLAENGAAVINMSFGLAEDRRVLGESCRRALDRGAVLVAAAPALGRRCFPAAYDGVISVTGDARCAPGVVADLGGDRADFGTYGGVPETPSGRAPVAGASIATAHFCGLAAAYLVLHPDAGRDGVIAHFRAAATLGEDPRRWRGSRG